MLSNKQREEEEKKVLLGRRSKGGEKYKVSVKESRGGCTTSVSIIHYLPLLSKIEFFQCLHNNSNN